MDTKRKHEKEKEDRDEQLRYSYSLRKQAEDERLEEDKRLLEKISQEMDTERRVYEQKRKSQKETMGKIWSATLQSSESKKEQRKKQQDAETEAMKAYISMLEA